jgi:hypothetical protein
MDIDALAALAANTVVAAAVTDAFEGLRAKVARVFGRDKPDPGIQRRLDATRRQLAAATQDDVKSSQAAQARQWETRFADLLADHPEAAALDGPRRDRPAHADHRDVLGVGAGDPVDRAQRAHGVGHDERGQAAQPRVAIVKVSPAGLTAARAAVTVICFSLRSRNASRSETPADTVSQPPRVQRRLTPAGDG